MVVAKYVSMVAEYSHFNSYYYLSFEGNFWFVIANVCHLVF